MSDLRSLAGVLAELPEEALAAVLRRRGVSPAAKLADFFDLAEFLLTPDSLETALCLVERPVLRLLAATPAELPADTRTALDEAALILPGTPAEPRYLSAVTEAVASSAAALLRDLPPAVPNAPGTPVPTSAARGVAVASELVLNLGETPARELSRGGLSQPEMRRLGTDLDLDPDLVPELLHLVSDARLISLEPEGWLPTEFGESWLLQTPAERWSVLARAWSSPIPEGFATIVREHPTLPLPALLRWWYPAGGERLEAKISALLTRGHLLGLLEGENLGTPGVLALTSPDTLASAVSSAFPPPITGVYVQHDLTIISPGTLESDLERTLRIFADLEARAEASTYRLTDGTIIRGLSAGMTAERMLGFLDSISLTGVPQPVSYLINQSAERFGSIRVGARVAGSRVRSSSPQLLDQIIVDRNLHALSLSRETSLEAHSRFDPEMVFWALTDAKYPVVAEDEHGAILRLRRRRTGSPLRAAEHSDHGELIARLHAAGEASRGHGDEAWLARRLGVALKAKETLEITVSMPGRGDYTFILEPTGIAGGRLRGLDKAADTERTLPLANITRVCEPGAGNSAIPE